MKYIDEKTIEALLGDGKNATPSDIDGILQKSRSLLRLTLAETAALLAVEDAAELQKIYEAAAYVKDTIYGRRVVLFAPLYVSNYCVNNCLYCGFRIDNTGLERKALSSAEIRSQVEYLLRRGHTRVLMVAGEGAPSGKKGIEYYTEAIRAIYEVNHGNHHVRRVNVNLPPLDREEMNALKDAGIGTYQLFQETYHEATYRRVHPGGPKSDPDYRLEAIDRAFQAGINDVGIGVLYGLYDYRFEVLAMLMHIEHIEKTYHVGPHTLSVPRIQEAAGSELSTNMPSQVSDLDFKKLVAVLRLSVPYAGIILSTRESSEMRDELLTHGVSQVSAESSTAPGGYCETTTGSQFSLHDSRSLDEVVHSLMGKKYIPSFCAACYRRERTGEAFMELAKPGTIKHMCDVNALTTLKEYLLDFASPEVKKEGYGLIEEMEERLDQPSRVQLEKMLHHIDNGVRDEYV
jgi:2-iminoacetate synthase